MKTLVRRILLLSLPLLVLGFGGPLGTGNKSVVAQTPLQPNPAGQPPLPQLYSAGWNLVAVTQRGDRPPSSALYTLALGGAEYQVVAGETRPGVGYWAYFPTDNRSFIVPVGFCEQCPAAVQPIPLPAGQWVMIGNPYTAPVPITVRGADIVDVYDPTTGMYQQTTQLVPGQGAFAYSSAGGVLTFGVTR